MSNSRGAVSCTEPLFHVRHGPPCEFLGFLIDECPLPSLSGLAVEQVGASSEASGQEQLKPRSLRGDGAACSTACGAGWQPTLYLRQVPLFVVVFVNDKLPGAPRESVQLEGEPLKPGD